MALRSRRLEGGAPVVFFRKSMCSLPRLANRRLRGAGEWGGAWLRGRCMRRLQAPSAVQASQRQPAGQLHSAHWL